MGASSSRSASTRAWQIATRVYRSAIREVQRCEGRFEHTQSAAGRPCFTQGEEGTRLRKVVHERGIDSRLEPRRGARRLVRV